MATVFHLKKYNVIRNKIIKVAISILFFYNILIIMVHTQTLLSMGLGNGV